MAKKLNRPTTTLFMLMSVDGKISTGDTDDMDFDKDLPQLFGAKEGLSQYYEIEKTTDIFSFNTGRVMAKIGVNDRKGEPKKMPVTFVIVDNRPHLDINGIKYLSKWTQRLILVTTNNNHPAFKAKKDNVDIIYYENKVNFEDLFNKLKTSFKAESLTIQSGGTMNAELIRNSLIDNLSIVIAPIIVGGKNTSSLIDGESLHLEDELFKIKPLELREVKQLNDSYLLLNYRVVNDK